MGPIGWHNTLVQFTKCGLRGYPWFDTVHRRHDNVINAANTPGVSSIRAERVITNTLANGPWEGQAHFQSLAGAAHELHDSHGHHWPVYRACYPFIVFDIEGGHLPADYGSEASYAHYWDKWIELVCFSAMGFTMQTGRWFQWEQ